MSMDDGVKSSILPGEIASLVERVRSEGKKIVLVTGVFDLLHQEHLNFLQKARDAGDFLLVGIESDIRVRELKGESRPVNFELVRLEQIGQLSFVDSAMILPDDFGSPGRPRELIATLRPDILAVSSHSPHLDKKRAILQEFGGRVEVVHQHNPEISTTKILAKTH